MTNVEPDDTDMTAAEFDALLAHSTPVGVFVRRPAQRASANVGGVVASRTLSMTVPAVTWDPRFLEPVRTLST